MNNRIIALLACFVLLICFSSCAKTQPTSAPAEQTNTDTQSIPMIQESISGTPTVYAEVSNENPAIGETVTVTVKLCNTAKLSSVDLLFTYDDAAYTVNQIGTSDIPNIVDSLNNDSGTLSYAGFVLRSEDVYDNTLFVLSVTPNENARYSNSFKSECLCLLTAADAEGNTTLDKTREVLTQDIVFNIHGRTG